MIVFGIDPGLRTTGWCVVSQNSKKNEVLKSGYIKTIDAGPLAKRLASLYDSLTNTLLNAMVEFSIKKPIAAIEKTYVNTNAKSSLMLAHARGCAMLALHKIGCNVVEYDAKTIKKTITGTGNANKDQISKMLNLTANIPIIHSHDEADAIAVAITHLILAHSLTSTAI